MTDDLPRRLRGERERRGFSVREMARRLDVSPSAISQIETGRARPSVSTLFAIVSELGMSLDELFTPEVSEPDAEPASAHSAPVPSEDGLNGSPVQRRDRRTAIELGTGVIWERLTAAPDPDVDFLRVVYPVGGSSSPNESLMRHSGREYGLVLSGSLEVAVGFDIHVLGAGDSISFDSTVPHRLRNVGDEPVIGVWIVIGRRATDHRVSALLDGYGDAAG